MSTVADFWSELLKGLHRTTSHLIPCLDGDPAKYACILPDVVTIRAKLLHCTLQDLPSGYKCGFYTSIPTPDPAPSLRVSIPYIEMHSSTDTDVPGDEVGNTGDVFVIQAPPKPSFWVGGPEKWLSVNDNVLSEHPFVNGFTATYREGTIVWEKLTPLKPARRPLSKQQPPLGPLRGYHRGSVALPASLPSTPTIHRPSKDSVDSAPAPAAAATPPGSPRIPTPGSPLKRASCPTSEASTAWRDSKRARLLPDEAVLHGQAISRKRSTSGSVSSESPVSNFARREGRPASVPRLSGPYAPSSDVKALQLMIQQRGECIRRQNEALCILRKRNAELFSENVTITKANKEIVVHFKSLKERQEVATNRPRRDPCKI
ncbi:hypothetical protein BDN67DRAFT_336201 [Paxillus ammoniavirescens]|nr:hypothetical protein BDN67DRAFT_336201 [Paxillus ammoniavirescens]